MEYSVHKNLDRTITVKLSGQFTSKDSVHFRTILTLLHNDKLETFTLDFEALEFIDSSALGMLLMLRDEAEKKRVYLELSHTHGHIRKMFEVTKFNQLFNLLHP